MKNSTQLLTFFKPKELYLNRDFATGASEWRRVISATESEVVFEQCNHAGAGRGSIRRLPLKCPAVEHAEARFPKPGLMEIWCSQKNNPDISYQLVETKK